jgi:hypothetical protein
MTSISIKHDLALLRNQLNAHGRQVPFATAVALTRTAKAIEKDVVKEMRDSFINPTPYTLKGTYTVPATKRRLVAEVGLRTRGSAGRGAGKYLQAQILGGARRLTGYEKTLRGAGLLPNGYYVVPGTAARIDAYGNFSRGQMNQILSYFKVQAGTAGYNRASSDKSKAGIERRLAKAVAAQRVQYFLGSPGDGRLPLGIWQRIKYSRGTAIKPVMMFVRFTTYEKRFDFYYVGEVGAKKYFPGEFARAWQDAIRTAR